MRLGLSILCVGAIISGGGCRTPIVAVERESSLVCPAGTTISTPNGETFTTKEAGMYLRNDIVNLALDARVKRK